MRNLKPAMPFLLLFGALLAAARAAPAGARATHAEPAPPPLRTTGRRCGRGRCLLIPLSGRLTDYQLLIGSKALLFACVTLSLVLLTGLVGPGVADADVVRGHRRGRSSRKLAGRTSVAHRAGDRGRSRPESSACLVALPVLRLRGHLPRAAHARVRHPHGRPRVREQPRPRWRRRPSRCPAPDIFGIDVDSEQVVFVLTAALRWSTPTSSSPFAAARSVACSRRMRDSPTACQTIGMNLAVMKLQVFGLSALLAGAAGVAARRRCRSRVGALDFLYFRSLTVLLVATIFGITSVSGALLGAAVLRRPPRGSLAEASVAAATTGRGAPAADHRAARHRHGPPARGPCRTAARLRPPVDASAAAPVAGSPAGRARRLLLRTTPPTEAAAQRMSADGRAMGRSRMSRCSSCEASGPPTARSRCCTASTSRCPGGSLVAVLGPNGAGKSTTLKVISGAAGARRAGRVAARGRRRHRRRRPRRCRAAGVCLIPEGRGIFPNLTVRENILMDTLRRGTCRRPTSKTSVRDRSPCWRAAISSWPGPCPAASSRCSPYRARSRPTRR